MSYVHAGGRVRRPRDQARLDAPRAEPRERLEAAADYGRAHGIPVIDGGCPCMFEPTTNPGHKAMGTIRILTGNVPRRV